MDFLGSVVGNGDKSDDMLAWSFLQVDGGVFSVGPGFGRRRADRVSLLC